MKKSCHAGCPRNNSCIIARLDTLKIQNTLKSQGVTCRDYYENYHIGVQADGNLSL
jgi:hypothetical protein